MDELKNPCFIRLLDRSESRRTTSGHRGDGETINVPKTVFPARIFFESLAAIMVEIEKFVWCSRDISVFSSIAASEAMEFFQCHLDE